MTKKGFSTKCIHSSYIKKDPHGALQVPIYLASAFEFDTAEDIAGAFQGTKPAHAYSRSGNPTVEFFEQRIKEIAGAKAVLACASGMAAITSALLTICKAGDNIITSKYLFGNTYSLFEHSLKPLGIEFRYADFTNMSTVEQLVDVNTRVIFFETITNPQIEVANVAHLSAIAQKAGAILISDATLTPPGIFDAGALGIDISVLSCTKFISGGGTVIGGLVIDHGSFDWSKNPSLVNFNKLGELAFYTRLKKEIFRNTGGCMSPMAAYMLSIGIETLSLRITKSVENTLAVAKWLAANPKVEKVNYPGLEKDPYYKIAQKQFGNLPGGLLSFELPSKEACFRFLNKLQLLKRATNMNDNKTLIIHPSSTIYSEYTPDLIQQMGVSDKLIRLSVGIEDVDDIIGDLSYAMNYV